MNIGTPAPSVLALDTGHLDDPRAELRRGHALFDQAEHAFHHQGEWSSETHAAYWRVALAVWPRKRGRPSTAQRTARVVDILTFAGCSPDEIKDALPIMESESFRTHGFRWRDIGDELRRLATDATIPRRRGPWVYDAEEDAERLVFPTLPPPDWQVDDDAARAIARAFGSDGWERRRKPEPSLLRAYRDGRLTARATRHDGPGEQPSETERAAQVLAVLREAEAI